MIYARFLSLLVFLGAVPSMAHEFWIEPQDYLISTSDKVVADFRNGQFFEGNSIVYIPDNIEKYYFILGKSSAKLEGNLGQRPAVSLTGIPDGLGIIVIETKPAIIAYAVWEKFQKFIDHKDFEIDKKGHLALGFPEMEFSESYRRFAKSLVGIGGAQGADRRLGLEIELVALLNPYTDDTTNGIPVQAFYNGTPLIDVQIELFEKDPNGEVEITLHRTNDEGIAILPITNGHSYMVDTVQLREAPDRNKDGVVWETLWASLTFAKE